MSISTGQVVVRAVHVIAMNDEKQCVASGGDNEGRGLSPIGNYSLLILYFIEWADHWSPREPKMALAL